MKTILLMLLIPIASNAGMVRGYVRQNGTYVQPYYRTNPDTTTTNNLSAPSFEYAPPRPRDYSLPTYDVQAPHLEINNDED